MNGASRLKRSLDLMGKMISSGASRISSIVALVTISACMTQNQSKLATRHASEITDPFSKDDKLMMIYENGTETHICLLSPGTQRKVKAAQEDQPSQFKAAKNFGAKTSDSFSMKTRDDVAKFYSKSPEPCNLDWEEWFIKSIALGKPAPVDVASIVIPNLAEIKMGIASIGLAAGLCGRPIEAAAVAICSISLNYAQDKGLVRPAN